MMNRLIVLYDTTCPLCVRCKTWMEQQPAYVELVFRSSQSYAASADAEIGGLDLRGLRDYLGQELVVLSDEGEAWVGPAAFLMCLWALRDYREWSYRLSGDAFLPLAERFFHALSGSRRRLASFLFPEPVCADGSCSIEHRRNGGSARGAGVPHSPYR